MKSRFVYLIPFLFALVLIDARLLAQDKQRGFLSFDATKLYPYPSKSFSTLKKGWFTNNATAAKIDTLTLCDGQASVRVRTKAGESVRAMFHLFNNYKKLHQCDTLRKLINRWAPPTENQTDRYVAFVAHYAKISPDKTIDTTNPDVMIPVVRSMIKMENGVYIDEQDLKKGWELFLKYK